MNADKNIPEKSGRFIRRTGKKDDTVILIHGWGVRALFMDRLADFLIGDGYTVLNYDYLTSRKHIPEHAADFLARFREENITGKIFFLTHSMGGLVLRHAMANMTSEECRRIDSIVMLGPPNKGSLLAIPGRLPVLNWFNRSWGDMVPGSKNLQIPAPAYLPPVGIIAGLRDGKVAFKDTALPDGMPFERTCADCSHPGLRHPENTGAQILKFFRKKTFI